MKLISWNVNGIRAVNKKGFLEWLKDADPDILCLQETKAHVDQLPGELLEGHVQEGLGVDIYDREGRVLITEHPNFLLYNIYFPNGQRDHERLQYKLDFYDELLPIINEQVESGNNVIVTGDWNTAHHPIDLARPKENIKTSGFMPIERQCLDTYVENGWVDTFRLFHPKGDRYSWWTYRFGARERNVGWRIDYFFVNEGFTDQVLDADIHDEVMGSDHCPVSIEISE